MTRRSSLPGADELFRSTSPAPAEPAARPALREVTDAEAPAARPAPARVRTTARRRTPVGERQPTGRERHDEKITVYVSADELLDLEHGRLALRGEHGLAVDRGRIVREALAHVLADLEAKGESSILVRRLRGR